MGKRVKWDIDRAIEMLKQGHTCRFIADAMGLKREQVYDAFRNRNLEIVRDRRGFKPSWDMERARELANQGFAIFEIAKIMGLPQDLIRSGFKNRGWKPIYTRSGRHVTWDVEKAKALREKGLKWVEIDRAMHLTPGTVRHYFVRKGIHQPRRQPNMQWDIQEALKLRERGMSWKEIGDRVGTDGNNVRRAFVRRGWLDKAKRPKMGRKVPRIRMSLSSLMPRTG